MSFDLSLDELVVWVVIGLLAGSLAGMVVNRRRDGFGGALANLLFGLVGALIGGILFDALNIELGLPKLTIDVNKVAAAFVGALLVVLGARFFEGRNKKGD